MTLARQLIVVGGMVLFSTSALSAGQAYAFGQQWRPAEVDTAGVPGRYSARVANMPAFRPQRAASSLGYQRSPRYQPPSPYQAPSRYQPPAPTYAYAPAYPMPYPQTAPVMPYGVQPAAYYQPAGSAFPAWARPFGEFAQAWPYPAPPFAPQFAWNPGVPPWMGGVTPREEPRYRPQMAPQMTGFRPSSSGQGYAEAYGSWRPAVQAPVSAPVQHYGRIPAYADQRQVANVAPAPVYRPVGEGLAAPWNPASAGLGRAYWRPEVAMRGNGWRDAGAPFRPVAYGRNTTGAERYAWRGESPARTVQDRLPGWATTFQDTAFEDGSCSWCGGS